MNLVEDITNICRIYTNRGEHNVVLKCRLKAILALKDIKHSDFAKTIKVNPGTISAWIAGKSNPSLEKAYEIAELLGVSVTEIWVDESRTMEEDLTKMLDLDGAINEYFKKKE
jgi:DNA-binding XRE family transcriptional regulator